MRPVTVLMRLGCAVCAAGQLSCAGPPAHTHVDQAAPLSFLTGPELASHVLGSVVLIDNPTNTKERGVGLIVGHDAHGLLAVTAAHVVRQGTGADEIAGAAEPTLVAQVGVRLCERAGSSKPLVGTPIPVSAAGVHDIALVRIQAPRQAPPVVRLMADPGSVRTFDEAWVAGLGGDCAVGGASGTFQRGSASGSSLAVRMPGAYRGSSGAPVLTGRGVAGLLKAYSGGTDFTDVTSIEAIRAAALATLPMTWWLTPSGNLPPSDPNAASRELIDALDHYVVAMRSAHETLMRDRVNDGELAGVVRNYNVAFDKFFGARNKHDGTVLRYWGPDVLAHYRATREGMLTAHWNFLGLSREGWVNTIYRTNAVPAEVRRRMGDLTASIEKLHADVDATVSALSVHKEAKDLVSPRSNRDNQAVVD